MSDKNPEKQSSKRPFSFQGKLFKIGLTPKLGKSRNHKSLSPRHL